jgi:undecaprenyl-diphosphatase
VIIAFAFKETFESLFESGKTLGLEFIFTGLVLFGSEALAKRRVRMKTMDETSYLDAAFVGTA